MRFMMMVIPEGYASAAPDTVPSAEAVAKMIQYNKALQRAGILLAMEGLLPPSTGAHISYATGKATVADGPFPEAKEAIGGYWIIQPARGKKPSNGQSGLPPRGARHDGEDVWEGASVCTGSRDFAANRHESLEQDSGKPEG
jgi:hypothetical protein